MIPAAAYAEFRSCQWRSVALPLAAVVLAIAGITDAGAEEDDRFKLSAGGFSVFRYDSIISLTARSVGLGVSFSPEDSLDLDPKQTVVRLDGRYRFSERHALTFSWYSITSDGARLLEDDIEWVDLIGNQIVIPAGTGITSSLGYDIYKVGYLWSFYHNDKVELSVGGGLHLTAAEVRLNAATTVSSVGLRSAEATVPLPVVSFKMNYDITPKLDWYLQAELFSIALGDWDGTYSDVQLGMEYRVFQNLGLGIGLASSSLKLIEDTRSVRFDFENRVTGVYLFATGHF